MNAKEFVQIVKKMFSKGLTPEEKIKLADEGPVCRLLLRQWDKFFGTSIENKKIEEEIWTNITDVCWNHKPGCRRLSFAGRRYVVSDYFKSFFRDNSLGTGRYAYDVCPSG